MDTVILVLICWAITIYCTFIAVTNVSSGWASTKERYWTCGLMAFLNLVQAFNLWLALQP